MIAGGIAIALLSGPIGIGLFGSLAVTNGMIGIGLTTAVAGTAGLLNPLPQDPSNIGPQGQLPVQSPNPVWRVIYGIFQFAGAITFEDGPMLGWLGSGANQTCEHQFIQRVHTLCCHQIAGFLAVVIDGQTFNFGTDLVLLTAANNIVPGIGWVGPPGLWGFINPQNPWITYIFFAFDSGDPGNSVQPFPFLVAGAAFIDTANGLAWRVGSERWTPTCLQRGRAKVHVLIHYNSQAQFQQYPGGVAAPQPYVLDSGRIPTIEFKLAGRIIQDYRVNTAWVAGATYPNWSYVLANGLSTPTQPNLLLNVFVQQNSTGVSAGVVPNFASVAPGATIVDGTCLWLNCGHAIYAAGFGQTSLNNVGSNKLGGPGGSMLIADAWQGTAGPSTVYFNGQIALWSAGPGLTSPGAKITLYYGSKNSPADPNLAAAFNSGQAVYVDIVNSPFGNGKQLVTGIGAGAPPGEDPTVNFLTIQAPSTSFQKIGGPNITGNIGTYALESGPTVKAVGTVIEAPIGWLQVVSVAGQSGSNRPNFATVLGGATIDGGITWICLGRSMYATCLPDNDGTQNQGGFANPALVVADYLQTPRNQFGLGAALTADSIDTVIAAANICDEPVVIEVF